MTSSQRIVAAAIMGRLLALLAIASTAFTAHALHGAEPLPAAISVRLASGRVFTASVDRKTNQDTLWLRFDGFTTTLLRPVLWNAVRQANVGGEIFTGPELRERAAALATARPARNPSPIREPERDDFDVQTAQVPPRLRSLQLDASPANWDADVEDDGILLRVYPLDEFGQVMPIDGTLAVDLIGDQAGSTARGQNVMDLGRWTRRLEPAAVGPNGAVFRLEYQAIHPEFFTQTSPYALVHARLSAPGHGSFEATTGVLRLRPYNGMRDRRQQDAGTRFFPGERTGLGVRRQSETGF